VCASAENKRVPWHKIPKILGWTYSVYAIKTAFKKEGFGRYSAIRKPKLTPEQAVIRLIWALEHKDWIEEQWLQIFWTDKTWMQPGRHKKVKVTKKKGEKLYKDYIKPRVQRRIG